MWRPIGPSQQAQSTDRSRAGERAGRTHYGSGVGGGELELCCLGSAGPGGGGAALWVDPGGQLPVVQADAAAGSLLHRLGFSTAGDCRCGGGDAAALALVLLTVGLLALFLPIEKRKAELRVAQDRGVITRKVLERYSLPLLLRLESTVATSAFISYALWAAGPALRWAPTSWMLLTVPFVLVGIFWYQLLSDPEEAERRQQSAPERSSEKPEEILLGDLGIKLTLAGWLVTTAVIGLLSRASG